jgi:hypothetical protein
MSSLSPVSVRTPSSNARIQASLVVLAGLLLAPLAHAENWGAYIGTGHVSAATNVPKSEATQASTNAPSPHWTSRIGTGHPSSTESSQRQTAAADVSRDEGASAPAPHWTSKIGTGSVIGS